MANEPRQPNGDRWSYETLCLARDEDLEDVMRCGHCPDLARLSGWEFRGFNTPEVLQLAGIRKFKKGFYRVDPSRSHRDGIQGYNVNVAQGTLGDPWVDVEKNGKPVRMGWYEVRPVNLADADNKYHNAALINYAASDKNLAVDPTRLLRDYLVQVYADNPDLYLGKAFLAFGPLRMFVSYFVLERHNPSELGA
ncbi:MAG: hypothetical protein HY907_22755 [Deltaproteobacteria bacterium]|nr:hypothetical protein [Deltaproteobacteria bacterium]